MRVGGGLEYLHAVGGSAQLRHFANRVENRAAGAFKFYSLARKVSRAYTCVCAGRLKAHMCVSVAVRI